MTEIVTSRVDDYIDRVRSVSDAVREHADFAEREGRLAPQVVESTGRVFATGRAWARFARERLSENERTANKARP